MHIIGKASFFKYLCSCIWKRVEFRWSEKWIYHHSLGKVPYYLLRVLLFYPWPSKMETILSYILKLLPKSRPSQNSLVGNQIFSTWVCKTHNLTKLKNTFHSLSKAINWKQPRYPPLMSGQWKYGTFTYWNIIQLLKNVILKFSGKWIELKTVSHPSEVT